MKNQKMSASWALILFILGIFILSGMDCPPTVEMHYLLGYYSYPTIYLTNGGANFSNPSDPVTGNDVKNATVTVSNETTGVSTAAAYVSSSSSHGYYQPAVNFSHNAGERVSLSVQTTASNITGKATITPNPVYSNLSPTSGATAALPFTISWDVAQGTYEASHTWVQILASDGSTAEAKNHQAIVPVSTKTLQITSSEVQAGTYSIGVFGVNTMSLSGAKTGSVVYVDGGGTSAWSYTVMVQ